MKPTFIAVLAAVLFSTSAYGQNQAPPNPGDMTPETFAAKAKVANTGAQQAALADVAFRSQNIELILACFRVPGLYGSFIDELEKLPPTEFRGKVARALLTEPWPMDKSPLGVLPPGSAPPPRLETFCLVELAHLLPIDSLEPDSPGSIDKLRSKEFRMKLSQQIDASVTAPKDKSPNASGGSLSSPENENQRLPHKSPPTGSSARATDMEQPSAPKQTPESKPIAPAPGEELASSTPWSIIVALIVAAGGLLWLLVKNRK